MISSVTVITEQKLILNQHNQKMIVKWEHQRVQIDQLHYINIRMKDMEV